MTGALLSLAERLDVPQLTRTMVLIAEGSRSTGDLHNLLEIAASFFGPITEQVAAADASATQGPVSLASTPVATYQTLFLHSALVQALGSGLLAGKLAENDAVSGLKYSLPLIVLTVVSFALFVSL